MKKYSETSMVAGIIMTVIAIVIAISFIAPIATNVAAATNNSNVYSVGQNVTGAANTLTGLTTLLFVAFVIITVYKMTIA
jgi:hypothetical protein